MGPEFILQGRSKGPALERFTDIKKKKLCLHSIYVYRVAQAVPKLRTANNTSFEAYLFTYYQNQHKTDKSKPKFS